MPATLVCWGFCEGSCCWLFWQGAVGCGDTVTFYSFTIVYKLEAIFQGQFPPGQCLRPLPAAVSLSM